MYSGYVLEGQIIGVLVNQLLGNEVAHVDLIEEALCSQKSQTLRCV